MRADISQRQHAHAATAANEVRREYPLVPLEDLRQEAALWVLSNPRKATEYEEHEDPRQGDRLTYSAMRNRLRVYAQTEISRAYGYSNRSDQFAHYSEAQLHEELLPAVFDREAWSSPPMVENSGVHHKTDPAHGNGWITMLADVADAFAKLDPEDRQLIRWRYQDDMPQREIARRLATTDVWVSDALARARARMVHLLGGERPVYERDELSVGRRRVLSNAAVQAQTGHDYAGE